MPFDPFAGKYSNLNHIKASFKVKTQQEESLKTLKTSLSSDGSESLQKSLKDLFSSLTTLLDG
jgi:hypothetical protein